MGTDIDLRTAAAIAIDDARRTERSVAAQAIAVLLDVDASRKSPRAMMASGGGRLLNIADALAHRPAYRLQRIELHRIALVEPWHKA